MTADFYPFEPTFLGRVVCDDTSKPPAWVMAIWQARIESRIEHASSTCA